MSRLASISLFLVATTACNTASKDEGKGVVDDSTPPSIPTEQGKADAASKVVSVDVQSPHPYTNNLDRTFAVSLASLPSCATRARVHFHVLRTEAGYDYVSLEPTGQAVQSFDGNRDNVWSSWFDIRGTSVTVRLDSDGSITRHGFEIDSLEWDGAPRDGTMACPLGRFPPCGAGTVDLAATPGVCACPAIPVCEPIANVEVTHAIARGRNHTTKHVLGLVAEDTRPGLDDGLVTHAVGSVDAEALAAVVRRAAESGLLQGPGYAHPLDVTNFIEEVTIKAGGYEVTFTAQPDMHDPAIAALASEIDALFSCGTGNALTCGNGFACSADETCNEVASCICPANFDPVCGDNGHTYSNACAAGCANAPVAHAGECGIAGDSCGTIFGLACQDAFKCRFGVSTFTYPFPDAGGACVATNYCDAPTDCSGPHPAVLGAWACTTNACSWKAGAQWSQLATGRFESTHPYTNGTSVWKEITLPANAQALRLAAASFRLERDYDFVEVWSWVNGAWKLMRRFTGTVGPNSADEYPGRYHYVRFVSDTSVTDTGFAIAAEWR